MSNTKLQTGAGGQAISETNYLPEDNKKPKTAINTTINGPPTASTSSQQEQFADRAVKETKKPEAVSNIDSSKTPSLFNQLANINQTEEKMAMEIAEGAKDARAYFESDVPRK